VKVVIAFDKFKGSLDAPTACAVVRRALLTEHPKWQVVEKPLADGGEGTAKAIAESLDGEMRLVRVMGPLPEQKINAAYGWLPRERTAIIEMAAASGLLLIPPRQRNPLKTTTYGTGQLIADAVRRGARRILLGVGGSATVDGGVGAAMAVGWKFYDKAGRPIGLGGGELHRIASVGRPTGRLPLTEVLCDVDNPLCGRHGSAHVYGPQKGATPSMVKRLDDGLRHLASVVRHQLGMEIVSVPGAGAAGGLAAGALAFFGARLVPGIETVMKITDLDATLAGADWVITGEGRFDKQSLHGKVVAGVCRHAQSRHVKVAVLAGVVTLQPRQWKRAGVCAALATLPSGWSTERGMTHAADLLSAAASKWAREN
jgi:glycerate 2-kinase